MPDSGASTVSTAGRQQFLALQRMDPKVGLLSNHRISSIRSNLVEFWSNRITGFDRIFDGSIEFSM